MALGALGLLVLAALVVDAAAQTPSSNDAPAIASPEESNLDIDPPRVTWAPNPKYPKSARHVGHQGTSILNLIVGADGRPHDITVVRPLDEELDACAIAAVQKWRYRPALRDGEPVEVQIHARIRFRLYDKSYGRIADLWDRSDNNDPRADLQLSRAYLEGNGVPQDYQLAFEFLRMAADWNLPEAQFLMGEHYYRDGSPDYVNAYMW